jgi:hypothetical protein
MRSDESTKRIGLVDLSVRIMQLIVSIIALVGIGATAYLLGSNILLFVAAIIAAVLIALLGLKDEEKNSWYRRLNALQGLRLTMEFDPEPLKGTMKTVYRACVDTNYQYALLEGRTELANYLRNMLDEIDKTTSPSRA